MNAPFKAPTVPRRVPAKRITKRLRHALDALADGRAQTIQAAADQAGLNREHVSRCLKLPHVQEYLKGRSERTIELLDSLAPAVLLHLMHHSASERVRMEVAKSRVASRDSRNPMVQVNVTPGYVVRLPASEGPLIEGQRQDEANPLISHEDGGE